MKMYWILPMMLLVSTVLQQSCGTEAPERPDPSKPGTTTPDPMDTTVVPMNTTVVRMDTVPDLIEGVDYFLPNIDLRNWKVTLPIGSPTEVEPPEILDYASNPLLALRHMFFPYELGCMCKYVAYSLVD